MKKLEIGLYIDSDENRVVQVVETYASAATLIGRSKRYWEDKALSEYMDETNTWRFNLKPNKLYVVFDDEEIRIHDKYTFDLRYFKCDVYQSPCSGMERTYHSR